MTNGIAIHESENSDKVVKFIELNHFTSAFQDEYNNNNVYGVFYNEEGKIVYKNNSGDIEGNII